MKKRSFALVSTFALALALTGCSASRESNTAQPSHSVAGSDSGVYETDGGNDALQGGGAGGTNDRNNDGLPDGSAGFDDQSGNDSGVGQAADDIGRAAGDLAHDAGDAIGDAVDDIDRDRR